MKITLAAAHQISKGEAIPLYGCLGVLALAGVLKQNNKKIEVIDLVKYHNLDNQKFADIAEEISLKILETNPDIVGFSTISDSLVISVELARIIKEKKPDIKIILGGPGASYSANRILINFKQIDFIIRGEADFALLELLNQLESGKKFDVKGLVYLENNKTIDLGWPDPVKNMDDLPMPAYEFCKDNNDYSWFEKNIGFQIEAGRGCPYNCNFCSSSDYFKRKFRVKSVRKIIEELKAVNGIFKNRTIRFNHDLLTLKSEYIYDLCDELEKNFPKIKWRCMSRLDTIDSDIVDKMVSAGCVNIYLGIEAATEKMQKKIGKRLDLSQLDKVLKSFRENNLEFIFSFVIGLPDEEISDVQAMYSVILKSKNICGEKCQVQIHPLMPEPGSVIMKEHPDGLIYDEENTIVDSILSKEWKSLLNIVKLHPDIFMRFFTWKKQLCNYPEGSSAPSMYAHFSFLAEEVIPKSLVFAFRMLGGELSTIILACFDKYPLDVSRTMESIDYSNFIENLSKKIAAKLVYGSYAEKLFHSILKYEAAAFRLNQSRNPNKLEKIEVDFSDSEYLELMEHYDESFVPKNKTKHIMLFWDKTSRKVKSFEVPEEMVMLALN